MIKFINEFISSIKEDLAKWDGEVKPWFRGESGNEPSLCPKIAKFNFNEENYLLQSFRRQAGGLANVPPRGETDLWLFLAQHHGVPTRLLDWTEGALHALYFAINRENANPKVYMLNPHKLNNFAGSKTYPHNYPLSSHWGGALYVALAWQNRQHNKPQKKQAKDIGLNLSIPMAFPAIYQEPRMIAQRSCFTIHGEDLKPIKGILKDNGFEITECLFEYEIDIQARITLLRDLSILGISAASIFPDLDHLATDLYHDVERL